MEKLLKRYKDLFDGTLGKWKNSAYEIELKEGATPYHSQPYLVPQAYKAMFHKEVLQLCEISVLKKVNHSEWAAPTFLIPKKDQTVQFISNFRDLNKIFK